MSDEQDQIIARKGRHVSLVIAGTMVVWLVLTLWAGPALGLPGRFALLFDFAALTALISGGCLCMQTSPCSPAARCLDASCQSSRGASCSTTSDAWIATWTGSTWRLSERRALRVHSTTEPRSHQD